MRTWNSQPFNLFKATLIGLTLTLSTPALAQMAEVPRPNGRGDFITARVLGNRGTYLQRQWVVVDADPNGLNCRDSSNRALVRLSYGAIIDSVPRGGKSDAIRTWGGQPWLEVRVQLFDVHKRLAERRDSYTCFVRANTRYIAPINPDTQ